MNPSAQLVPINVTEEVNFSVTSTRIPIKRLPGGQIVSSPMDFSILSGVDRIELAAAFMERMACALSAQLRIPRDQIDIATTEGPTIPFGTKRFIVIADPKGDSRIKTEEEALRFYRNPPARPAIPEFIDI